VAFSSGNFGRSSSRVLTIFHIVPKSFSHKEIGHLELPSMEIVLVKLLTNNLIDVV
jgi:hypothetical protein